MDKTRLRWGCRRGMLELDLLLLPFFEKKFDTLSEKHQLEFEALLEETDQDIYAWVLNFQACPHAKYASILSEIRNHHAIC